MSQVESVVKDIVNTADGYRLLVVKSTVPVGTTRWVRRVVNLYLSAAAQAGAKNRQVEIEVASNPEFLREGIAVQDFLYPDRIVIGAESERARQALLELYEGFNCPKLVTNLATAETIKYAANTFLATKISFINLVADFCEAVGADVELVARGMGLDQRIGGEFLKAGAGFGGSCLPKDLQAFICSAREHQVDSKLLESVLEINNSRPERLIGLLQKALWVIRGKQIAVLGLAFKSGTDDVRDTPAAKVIEKLKEEGASIRAYDPLAADNFQATYPEISENVSFFDELEPCVQDSHAMVVVTAWPQIVQLDLAAVKESMNFPIIVDGRNVFSCETLKELGFKYYPVGKPPAND
jgi:UDPglucose 6-dehydrogenase